MSTHIDDMVNAPIRSTPKSLYKIGDIVRVQIDGVLQAFAAIVCNYNLHNGTVELWVDYNSTQFWVTPGPDCTIKYLRGTTTDELYAATARGMKLAS